MARVKPMALPTQIHRDISIKDVPFDRFVRLARYVIRQAIYDAQEGNQDAAAWFESKDPPLWAEVCEVDQLWPLDPARLSTE